jgi:uncharacterized protein (DUF1330 family)
MKNIPGMAAAAFMGIIVGALLMKALHAQAPGAPAYYIANIESISDPATMARYRAAADKTEAPFGGKFLASGIPQQVDSSAVPKGTILILEFPSMKAFRDWWNSPAYSSLRPLRERSSIGRFYAIQGLAAP